MATEVYNRGARKAKIPRPRTIRNSNEFASVMNERIDAIMEHLAFIAYDKAREILEEDWYGRMTPESYERTYELLNALTVRRNSNGHYNLGVDARALTMTPKNSDDGFISLGQHMGFKDEPVASEMWAYINEGNKSPILPYAGIDVIGRVERYLDSVMDSEIKKFLK